MQNNFIRSDNGLRERIVVAMSGGVDSCAAALMLSEQGYEVLGVSMQVWDYRKNGGNSKRATCCAPADFDDAREVAAKCGFPFYVFDFEDSFYQSVIDPFINSYLNGETPNPCMDCNRKVKFFELRERARALGTKKIATGHYARVTQGSDGLFHLFSACDVNKDQSYFLYAMKQDQLAETLFPVGELQKSQVRNFLAEKGFNMSSKPESFDICFVSDSVSSFIEKEKGITLPKGRIRGSTGEILGEHQGIHNFTVGQRKGLRLSSENPLYVIQLNSKENEVIVGDKSELERKKFTVKEVNWVSGIRPVGPIISNVKLRYRHHGVRCKINSLDEGRAEVEFLDDWSAVSPGQAAVFYSLDTDELNCYEVFGGGVIERDND
jgi:tRNA-specific 2-thiouridylase